MDELVEQLRIELAPVVAQQQSSEFAHQRIAGTQIVPAVIARDPFDLIPALRAALPSNYHIPLLIELMWIYRDAQQPRGLASSSYHLARAYQVGWGVELAHLIVPLFSQVNAQRTVGLMGALVSCPTRADTTPSGPSWRSSSPL